ncbi:sigma-70 family RNA polymerase sigma factor [Leifsonia virtsii]|uniref:Sigma-70 family RNA polymerase sigma factor n=1 Tax=Leifsonia virtsii TaxID=3035915 RepID=A0ABT8J1V2_9MICO|nr:sigma-70 family RNA polymerase sigma factor [Leifsonia virtsii]MDN4598229.1 sigma-70 family RNA polymerase sigma factor [Leifsonia virtsii]
MNCRLDDLSDAELLALAREGDGPAYGVLFKRHWHAGRAMAASVTSRFEADDLASEAFARILKAVEKGNGPKTGFRSYLATTIRNVAIDWSRRKSTPNIEDADVIEDWTYSEVTALERMERETMAKAFYALPDSWQEVLWYTEVEDMAPREVAPLLGLTPNAVSALAVRAREGLRQSWINAHLAEVSDEEPEHAWVLSKLGSHVRGKLSRTDRAKVEEHLDACPSCADAAEEAGRVGSRLAMGILPLFLGIAGAVAYSAWTSERSGSAVAATLSGTHAAHAPAAHAVSAGPSGVVHAVRGAGRLRTLLSAGASASSSGAAAVAAVVAAAVLTTGAVMAAPQSSIAGGQTTSEPVSKTADRPAEKRHGSGTPEAPVAQEAPADEENQQGSVTTPSSPVPAPTAEASPAPAPAVPTLPAVEASSPTATPPAEPEPPAAPETPGPSPSATPAPPEPREDACEAAIRLVPADQTVLGYRLDDPAGSASAVDLIHGAVGRYAGSPGQPGWTLADSTLRPSTDEFTIQIRFKTAVGGGRLIGFSSAMEGDSPSFDRHLFLTDDGRMAFGVWPGTVHVISSPQSYLDDSWHQATATLSADGMKLYVDGALVAHDPSVTRAQQFSGYWRIGYESMFNWGPLEPTNWVFGGTLTHAAVYSTALTPEQISAQWRRCSAS